MKDNTAFVRIDKADGIATIWLYVANEKMNIISPSFIEVCNEVLDEIECDNSIEACIAHTPCRNRDTRAVGGTRHSRTRGVVVRREKDG